MLTTARAPHLSRDEAEDFLFRQAEYLDNRDFNSWANLFTSDADYWIPARPGDTNPLTQLSFMYDDRAMISARSGRLLDPNTAGQQPPTRSSHVIGNVRIEDPDADGTAVIRSRFHITQFRRDVQTYYSGQYTHHLVATESGTKIRRQRVDLIDCDGIHEHILQVYL